MREPRPSQDVYLFGYSPRIAHELGDWVQLHKHSEPGFDALPPRTATTRVYSRCGRKIWEWGTDGYDAEFAVRIRWDLLNPARVRLCKRCWRG